MPAAQNFADGITLYLAKKLTPGGTVTVTTDPGTDGGRLFFKNNYQIEWISFTSVTLTDGYYVLGGVTRDIDQYDIPITSNSTGKTWLATQSCVLVQMHDQIVDKNVPQQIIQEALTFADLTARDAALGGDGVATYNYTDVKVTSTGLFYNYNTTSGQWEVQGTGTATPNASTTVAGSVEIATSAQSIAGTDTGETGAKVLVLPSDIAKNEQSKTFVKGISSTGNDAYVVTLVPAPAGYVEGMEIFIKPDTVNTGACSVNVNGLGVKNIKGTDGLDPKNSEILNTTYTKLRYDGTNFIIIDTKRATSAEIIAGVNEEKYVTPAQIAMSVIPSSEILASSNSTVTTTETTYTKLKEILINLAGTYVVSFALANNPNGLGISYGKIYKNGVALGTERSSSSSTETTYTESFTFASGDLVQIYGKENGVSDNCAISNFKILGLIIPIYTIPTVNL